MLKRPVYENCFQDNGHQKQRTMIPKRWKIHRINPIVAPIYALRKFPDCSAGGRNKDPVDSPNGRDRGKSPSKGV